MSYDLVFGLHSIAAALVNPRRIHQALVCSEDGWYNFLEVTGFKPTANTPKPQYLAPQELQNRGAKLIQQMGLEVSRIPSSIYLVTSVLETFDMGWLRPQVESKKITRILALDQISDVNNGAAILRTASFYGVQAILIPQDKSFGLTPGFYRIASGAPEFVSLVRTAHLSRSLTQLKESGVIVIGLSEHQQDELKGEELSGQQTCLVLGAEDKGLSNAVLRCVDKKLSLKSQGSIKSLNVASAAAIAMEKCFGE